MLPRSDAEKLLVQRWLLWMQLEHKLYNVDNRHQCLRDSRTNIITLFHGWPNFFGCTVCGQYHICRMDSRECVVISDPQQQRMTCQYSGLLLSTSEAFVDSAPHASSSSSKGTGDPSKNSTLHSDGNGRGNNTSKSREVFMKKRVGYSNSRIRLPKCVDETKVEEVAPVISMMTMMVPDVRHKESLESEDECELEVEVEAEDDNGGMEEGRLVESYYDDNDDVSDSTNRIYHSNYDYWNDYYSFLSSSLSSSPLSLEEKKEEKEEYIAPTSPSEVFDTNLLTSEMECEIVDTTRVIIQRLLLLQISANKNTIERSVQESILTKMTLHFSHLIRNIVLLVYNAPSYRLGGGAGELTPKTLCAVLLLNLFLKSRDGYDACGYRFVLWGKNLWLSQLHEEGIMGKMFIKKKGKKRVKSKKIATTTNHDQHYDMDKLSAMASEVKECLDFYSGYDLWLKQFILNNKMV